MRSRKNRTWYAMRATTEVAEIFIYDEIGMWGITAKDFVADLQQLKGRDLALGLNTAGGSVFEGMAIYNALDRHEGTVTVSIDGLAASIGSVIALAGDEVKMAANAFVMIHDPWAITLGTATEHRKSADNLDKISGSALDIYENRTDLDRGELASMMADETWFNATEAKAAGFADAIDGESDAAAQQHFDLSRYRNVPAHLAAKSPPDDVREFEAELHRMGYSRSDARGIALHGFNPESRREAGSRSGRRDAGARLREAGIEELAHRIRKIHN